MTTTPTLAAIRPNAGLRVAYQKRLYALIDEMLASLAYWVAAAYRAAPPEALAQDASPAREMAARMRRRARQWQRRFDKLAPELASYFATAAQERVDGSLQTALRAHDFTVRFKATAAQNDAFQAVVQENIDLIKSISQKYLTQVQGSVMRSVAVGRDLASVTKDIEALGQVTKRRAALIARDQNNKATAVMERVRQRELGIKQAIWLHSRGGREPRPSHVAFSGKVYDIEKGAYLDGKWVWPGTEINCRCVSKAVIPGLTVVPA